MSRFSILFENGVAPDMRTTAEKQRGKHVLADLQLDRAVAIFCPEAWIREPFLEVLTMPLSDPADVRFRYRVGECSPVIRSCWKRLSISSGALPSRSRRGIVIGRTSLPIVGTTRQS